MKKTMIVLSTLAAVCSSSAFAAAGTVNFSGNILDSACDVAVASQNQTVIIGNFYRSEFTEKGDRTAAKDFDIILKDCPDTVTSAKVRFDGAPDKVDPSLLAINSAVEGAASGVAINLMSADKTDLPLHGENNYNYDLSNTQDNTLKFFAQYISTASSVTAGSANSVANFSVVYN
ncbi:type 1 fimbrial protein [Leclercia adecarboxylata]|uniref:fimbrial protein n=1 Tax=Leclercia adecarboxylata TaxID=83655 RepID=UPI002DC03C50|nr:fimbrial protein [Leclercia adecarboxylata]MEB6377364.1 type 1 fimbrial protein [Leclercia adecarboxylata]